MKKDITDFVGSENLQNKKKSRLRLFLNRVVKSHFCRWSDISHPYKEVTMQENTNPFSHLNDDPDEEEELVAEALLSKLINKGEQK